MHLIRFGANEMTHSTCSEYIVASKLLHLHAAAHAACDKAQDSTPTSNAHVTHIQSRPGANNTGFLDNGATLQNVENVNVPFSTSPLACFPAQLQIPVELWQPCVWQYMHYGTSQAPLSEGL